MSETTTPALEMLWEASDPGEVLRTRFGFQDARAVQAWVIATIAEHFGVRDAVCERVVMSDRNALAWIDSPGGRLLAKWSVEPSRFARLAALAELTAWLGTQGLPVSAPVAARVGSWQVETGGVSLGLQRVIDGELLDVNDRRQVHAAGATLARLHEALAAHPAATQVPDIPAPALPLHDQVTKWLESTSSRQSPPAAREALRRLVTAAPREPLPAQLVHGDYRSANILCSGQHVAAVIDFEECRRDHPVVELARSAVMLGTRFHDWGPVLPSVHATLLAGYASQRPLSPVEEGWWDALVLWFSLLLIPPGDDPTGWATAALQLAVGP